MVVGGGLGLRRLCFTQHPATASASQGLRAQLWNAAIPTNYCGRVRTSYLGLQVIAPLPGSTLSFGDIPLDLRFRPQATEAICKKEAPDGLHLGDGQQAGRGLSAGGPFRALPPLGLLEKHLEATPRHGTSHQPRARENLIAPGWELIHAVACGPGMKGVERHRRVNATWLFASIDQFGGSFMSRSKFLLTALTVTAMTVSAALVNGSAQASPSASTKPQAESVTAVVSHLNNPRGLVMSGGRLYVAEGGSGGTHCFTKSPGKTVCFGTTGSIDMIDNHGLKRLVSGLMSVGGPGGIAASGPAAVAADDGKLFAVMAGNTTEIPSSGIPSWLARAARAQLGQFGVVKRGQFHPLSGVGDADYRWTAEHSYLVPMQFPDSNPNGLLVDDGRAVVADAGANALAVIGRDGHSHVAAFFPAPADSSTDSVTTCVAQGPDHALYVGELLGGSFAPGAARVWRVAWKHGKLTKSVWATGLTTVQACGFDRWGNFYATEFQVNGLNESPTASPLGAVVKISRNGMRTVLGLGHLFWPSGFAAGRDGSIYVSNCSIAPSTGFGPCTNGGQIVRIN